jgi:hypothetical protein
VFADACQQFHPLAAAAARSLSFIVVKKWNFCLTSRDGNRSRNRPIKSNKISHRVRENRSPSIILLIVIVVIIIVVANTILIVVILRAAKETSGKGGGEEWGLVMWGTRRFIR